MTKHSAKPNSQQLLSGAALLVSLTFACGNPKQSATPTVGGADDKQAGAAVTKDSGSTLGGGTNTSLQLPAGANLVDATFTGTGQALGFSMCNGSLEVQVGDDVAASMKKGQIFEVPQGQMTCPLSGVTIDLSKLMAAYSQPTNKFVVQDGTIALQEFAGSKFDPPRPLMPAFLSATPAVLANLNVSKQVTVTTADGKTDSGTVTLKMLTWDQPYQATGVSLNFPHTFDFEVTVTGFDNVDALTSLLVPKMGFKMSLNPVTVLEIRIESSADKLLVAAGDIVNSGSGAIQPGLLSVLPNNGDASKAAAAGDTLGASIDNLSKNFASNVDVSVTFDLTEEKGLTQDAITKANTSLGETVNGKTTGN